MFALTRSQNDGSGESRRPGRFERIKEGVSDRDRQWFQQHPNEDRYLRPYVPGESWPRQPDTDSMVLVECYRDATGEQIMRRRINTGPMVGTTDNGRMTLVAVETGLVIAEDIAVVGRDRR